MTTDTPSPLELCPTCGTRVPEGAAKCLVCGTEFARDRAAKPAKAVQGSRMPEITLSVPVALALLALFLGIGAGLVFLAIRQEPALVVPPTPTHTPTVTVTPTLTPTPVTPTPTDTPLPTPTPFTYKVQENDTCISIAVFFDVSVNSIVLLNSLPSSCTLFIGQELLIPQPTPTPTPVPSATLSPAEATDQACEKANYKVQANDTLSTIAANYQVSIDVIKNYNGLVSDTVYSGQNLVIPLCQRFQPGVTPLPTAAPPYPAPNLLLPADGAPFTLANDTVTLQWASVGTLRENEAYIVTIVDVTDPEGRQLIQYVTDTKFIVPGTFRPGASVAHVIRWSVGTVRQAGTGEDGLPVYEPAGATSTPRVFTWVGTGAAPTP